VKNHKPFSVDKRSARDVKRARLASGLSQAEASARVRLRCSSRWSEYERGVRVIDAARWELFLLLTDLHPTMTSTRR
jgi:hypothetical protein